MFSVVMMLSVDSEKHSNTKQLTLYSATMGKYDLIKSENPPSSKHVQYSNQLGQTVPSRGTVTSERCGDVIGFFRCSCGHSENWTVNCGKAECPVCHKNWLERRTKDSGRRLSQISKLLHIAPYHLILSPPNGWTGSRRELIKMAKKAGVVGGLMIYHPWRFRKLSDDSPVSWKNCDINPRSEKKIPSYGKYSPHVHILGWGYLMKSNDFYRKTGWFYKNRGNRPGKEMYATLYYQLSHSVIDGRKQSLSWFGITANNKLLVTIEERYLAKLCPICQQPMDKFQYYEATFIEVDNLRKTRLRNYKFKNGTPRLR